MASAEPIIVVLGPLGGGTSAVASVLHHLGVFMGSRFDASYRELHQIWEDAEISALCRRAITLPSGSFRWNLLCSAKSSECGLTSIVVPRSSREFAPA